jgi:ATPase subunit of ABC transporter with duplicated ATPase domains
MVCTHMADLDYGELRVYPGNYDEYMTSGLENSACASRTRSFQPGATSLIGP